MDKKIDNKLVKPHYYGKVGDVHVWHATHESHASMVGIHVDSPNDDKFNDSLDEARTKKVKAVVIHGTPPETLRTRINQDLGVHKPGKLHKTEVGPFTLEKTYLQNDKQTKVDIKAHTGAIAASSAPLMEWGTKKLATLPKDAVESFELDGKTIKVRKHDADVYSGWIETKDGNMIHQFEKIQLPELMTQLQSKLELYGREEEAVKENDIPDVQSKLLALREKIRGYLEAAGLDHEDKPDATPAPTPASEDSHPAVEANGEARVDVPTKELVPGMLNPEKECPACERPVADCCCFTGMPKPRLEFDGRKVTIFFKSEHWDEEAREAFIGDLKRRAGRLLRKKFS